MRDRAEIAIVGAGMAGASLAAELAGHVSVMLIEAESQPGYHATGRSAAFWSEGYGGPEVQPLTSASGTFLASPPADFADLGFLNRRGAITLADAPSLPRLEAMARDFAGSPVTLERLCRGALEEHVPGLRPGWDWALYEAGCADIDVARLHQAYLKHARKRGARLHRDARIGRIARRAGGWLLAARDGEFAADILVDAAGAWADDIAAMADVAPLGIRPYRRTLVQLVTDPPPPSAMPLVIDAGGRFYFKPEAGGRLWLSPHDESPCEPSDCAPEEIDVARAIAGLQSAVDWRIGRIEARWAGLRSFAPDRLPIFGFAPDAPGFFWCAGQGGFGIQTAPAAAKLAAALLLGRHPEPMVEGIDPSPYAAERFSA
ncbi:MAG: NAD(P)/FAD-dependent oxidoreductase [Sphingomonadaceae bacterium]